MSLIAALNQLLFPSRCLICSTLGESLCRDCSTLWRTSPKTVHYRHKGQSLFVTSSIPYSHHAQKVILAAKESHIKAADDLIAVAMRDSILTVMRNQWIDGVISIPSRPSLVRKRGREFLADISSAVADEIGINNYSLLRHRRKVRDQSGLNINERWNNLEGALVVHDCKEEFSHQKFLLIDDLVTTGATLLEGARALRYAGIEVVGGVTACIAEPLR